MFKKIMIGMAVLIVVIGAGAYYGWSHLDRYVRAAVEKYGSAATQTAVELGSVHISIASGEGTLSGLSVANPKGFSLSKAMSLGSITVKLDTGSITGNGPIVIRQIIIDKPQVSYELTNSGDSNLSTIQKNAQSYAASASGSGNKAGAQANAGGGSGRKIIIDDLVVSNGQVSVSQQSLPKPLSTSLPTIHLTDIGKNSGGATAAQVAQQLLGSITNAAAKSALTEMAKEKIGGALKAVPVSAIGGGAADTIGNQLNGLMGQ